jgi:hypothetical protein
MFSDEKGYLVTEMVWEDCSDSELVSNEGPLKHEDVKPKNNGSKSVAAPVKLASKPVATKEPGSQKSMMSFFGKK